MKCRRKWSILICLVLLMISLLVAFPVSAGEVRVITSQSTPVDSVDDATIKSIFLGKKSTWPNGNAIEFVVLEGGETHKAFLKAYVKKNTSQYKTYWKKQVFTGKGKNPRAFASEGELTAYVAGKPGAVGYVSAGTEISGLKVINEK